MALTFYWYAKCGTCRKAKKWLDDNGLEYEAIPIAENPPTKEEILSFMEKADVAPKKFFNTSGKKYRELQLKDKVNDMTKEEMAELLASDGMLIKRPIVTDGNKVTVGFNEETFAANWLA
ncbi:hypothetical protein GCM10010978_14620 [Compostibacillus humi]|uniref:Arsenate reductase n=1 Tax=Compostibacillus humi TaxID=1245525 RepID=A0A8J2ZSP2_9BACI|nr:arsenate reductase family protein [Compostibacillus humi]GGH75103.1 hypothetical protein GCM10010978_14620 [Compostibacillus humi]HLT56597.1 arsenate reductase family protein [Bacillota bacterium]